MNIGALMVIVGSIGLSLMMLIIVAKIFIKVIRWVS